MEKYKIGKTLGDGTFGTVFLAVNEQTGEQVAIKKMK
jgi:protein kinase